MYALFIPSLLVLFFLLSKIQYYLEHSLLLQTMAGSNNHYCCGSTHVYNRSLRIDFFLFSQFHRLSLDFEVKGQPNTEEKLYLSTKTCSFKSLATTVRDTVPA